jgi:hypothetical protein
VDDLLFYKEAELPSGLQGSPAFQRAFQANAPRAANDQSLKDFSLEGHLFQNRCSYLIYSESFLALPPQLKRRVYARLEEVLSGTQAEPRYAHLAGAERGRIAQILRETHPEFRTFLAARAAGAAAESSDAEHGTGGGK